MEEKESYCFKRDLMNGLYHLYQHTDQGLVFLGSLDQESVALGFSELLEAKEVDGVWKVEEEANDYRT